MHNTPVTPVSGRERIQVIDILRGLALFGILLVNMATFKTTAIDLSLGILAHVTPLDQLAERFIHMFATRKFVTMFSFLFGLGLSIMMGRAEQSGASFVPMFIRRLLALLGFGAVHAIFIWSGDILMLYASLGFILLILFRNASDRALRIWAGILLAIPLVLMSIFYGLGALVEVLMGRPLLAEQITAYADSIQPAADAARRAYRSGSFLEMIPTRLAEVGLMYRGILTNGHFAYVLGLFLVGMQVGRAGIFQNLTAHAPLLRRVMLWGYGLGLPLSAIAVVQQQQILSAQGTYLGLLVSQVALLYGGISLCFAYVATVSWLVLRPGWAGRLAVLAPVGRMGLTNYLLQSVFCASLFYGLGLFGKVGAATGLLITIGIYSAQIALSHAWLSRFRFGPMEWLWRSITYLKVQPMRRLAVAPADEG